MGRILLIKTATADVANAVEAIEEQWEATFPGNPIDYFFLDDTSMHSIDLKNGFNLCSPSFLSWQFLLVVLVCLGWHHLP